LIQLSKLSKKRSAAQGQNAPTGQSETGREDRISLGNWFNAPRGKDAEAPLSAPAETIHHS
jgi:hypothetical protein